MLERETGQALPSRSSRSRARLDPVCACVVAEGREPLILWLRAREEQLSWALKDEGVLQAEDTVQAAWHPKAPGRGSLPLLAGGMAHHCTP